jgi:hypothetical protein
MHPYTFIISLRASHPTADLELVTNLLGRQPNVSWVAGDERKTPKGTLLGGVRENSYWVTRLTEEETGSESYQLEDLLEKYLSEVSVHAKELGDFVQSGGRLEFFVSVYGDRNFGLIFSPGLLSRLGAAHIELQLDVYPTA